MKKDKYKQKVQRILEHAAAGKPSSESNAQMEVAAADVVGGNVTSQSAPSTASANAGASSVAGSALAAVRHHSREKEGVQVLHSYLKAGRSSSQGNGSPEKPLDDEELLARKLKLKQQQEKVAAHLTALTEAKKAEEAEKKQQEERSRRRKQLLRARLQQETNERKLMALHDKPLVQRAEATSSSQQEKKLVVKPAAHSISEPSSEKKPPLAARVIPPVEKRASLPPLTSAAVNAPPAAAKSSKITPEAAEAAVLRLSTVKVASSAVDGSGGLVGARDFIDWKRKNSVPADGKVFGNSSIFLPLSSSLSLVDIDMHFSLRSHDGLVSVREAGAARQRVVLQSRFLFAILQLEVDPAVDRCVPGDGDADGDTTSPLTVTGV